MPNELDLLQIIEEYGKVPEGKQWIPISDLLMLHGRPSKPQVQIRLDAGQVTPVSFSDFLATSREEQKQSGNVDVALENADNIPEIREELTEADLELLERPRGQRIAHTPIAGTAGTSRVVPVMPTASIDEELANSLKLAPEDESGAIKSKVVERKPVSRRQKPENETGFDEVSGRIFRNQAKESLFRRNQQL